MSLFKQAIKLLKDALLYLWRQFAARVLGLVPSDKPYGTALSDALNRMEPHFAFESALLRENPETHRIEVYLTQRMKIDTAYPGEYHCPGSAVRNGEAWEDVAKRLARDEYKSRAKSVTMLHEAGFFYQEERGWYQSVPSVVTLETESAVGKWYPVDELPEKTVAHHRDLIIPAAVAYWKNRELYEAGRYLLRLALSQNPEAVDQSELRRQIAAAFKYVQGRTLGPLYSAVGPLCINDSLEFGIVRRSEEGLQGYMILHNSVNPRYANEWHFPGLQQLPGEDDGTTALRGMTKKYPGLALHGEAVFIKRFPPSAEGYPREAGGLHINAHLWLVVGDNNHLPVDDAHGWFPLESLPDNSVWSHSEIFAQIYRDAFLRWEQGDIKAVRETQILNLDQLQT